MFDDFIIPMFFADQFEDGLKEIAVEAKIEVNRIQERNLFRGVQAVITNQVADH